jgi:SNF2 family DNA or RNA helicase
VKLGRYAGAYVPKTDPLLHQADYVDRFAHEPGHACFNDPGTGKTKIAIDIFCKLLEERKVNAMFVVCPNSLKQNWSGDEFEKHMPDRHYQGMKILVWSSQRAGTQAAKRERELLLKHSGPVVLIMSYHGVMTTLGHNFAKRLLASRKAFYPLDESQNIKDPETSTTERIVDSGAWAPYRMLMTGTPMPQGPTDIYSQIAFLDPEFWPQHGIGGYMAFKHMFCVYKSRWEVKAETGVNPGYDKLIGYKNVELLNNWLKKLSSRVTKKQAGLNIPDKLYTKRYFAMSPQQKKHYDEMKNLFITEIAGQEIDGSMQLNRILRLQQITRGYAGYKIAGESELIRIPGPNPALDVTMEICESIGKEAALIWSPWTEDINQICEALDAAGKTFVKFNGEVTPEQREINKQAFNRGDAQFFVGNPAAGGVGLTLLPGVNVIYHANGYKLVHRLQSEDRSHRIGQTESVTVYDVCCPGTIDMRIITALRAKKCLQEMALGDEFKEWI